MNHQHSERFLKRFWRNIEVKGPDDCWIWQGSCRGEYGTIGEGYNQLSAHRVAYELVFGDPGDFYVLHDCDTPRCVNPRHLFLGTQLDNMRDKTKKERQANGERGGNAKLTDEQVNQIRAAYIKGVTTYEEIGRAFGVSMGHIRRIVLNIQRVEPTHARR